MKTLNFKVWLVVGFLSANFARPINDTMTQQEMICINSATDAYMNGQKQITYIPGADFEDGDVVTVTMESGTVITAEKTGMVWRYDNKGTFTEVSYPWHYEGNKPETVHTEVR